MHSQALVIYPKDIQLEEIMDSYQEIDKTVQGKMQDKRCQFFLQLKEEDIPELLEEIKEYCTRKTEKFLEMIQYRANHSPEQVKEKYNYSSDSYTLYKMYKNRLNKYEKIKDLPVDDARQINFIKEMYDSVREYWVDIYIKGIGYGIFHNPYELWDYYQDASIRLGNQILVNYDGESADTMSIDELDVDATLKAIKEYTRVWEHIIYLNDQQINLNNPANSRLFTIDTLFADECKVDDLEGKLRVLEIITKNRGYVISAIDMHR